MAQILDHRHGPDRRRQPRGGRRTQDGPGVAPLVLMIGEEPGVMTRSEAVLAKLHFAVSIVSNAEDALRVIPALHPDLVVATDADSARIRLETPENVPVVRMETEMQDNPEMLVQEIRRALRLHLAR